MDKDSISSKELKWTKDKPTEPGFYWVKSGDDTFFTWAHDRHGRWYGPDARCGRQNVADITDDTYFYGPIHPPAFIQEDDESTFVTMGFKPPQPGDEKVLNWPEKTAVSEANRRSEASHDDEKCSCGSNYAVYVNHPEGYACVCEKKKADADKKCKCGKEYLTFTAGKEGRMKCVCEQKLKADFDWEAQWAKNADEILKKEKCDHIVGVIEDEDGEMKDITSDIDDWNIGMKFKYCPLCGEEL